MTAVLCWAGMVVMSSLYVTIPLTVLFSDLFKVSLAQSAATGSIFSVGFAIGCLLFGAISDKYGRKKVIFIGLLALSIVSFLLGIVDSLFWFLLFLRVTGDSSSYIFSSSVSLRCRNVSSRKRLQQ